MNMLKSFFEIGCNPELFAGLDIAEETDLCKAYMGKFPVISISGVSSNSESGGGYSDILVEIEEEDIGIVIEVKYSENDNLEADCKKALEQIEEMGYQEGFRDMGMQPILKYGIACYKKRCRVLLAIE